jgi:hypothetical protein
MVNKSSEDFPNLASTIRESMDGRLPPIDDPDVKTYSYALYNCEYCHVRVFLSFETKAGFNTPHDSKPGAILVLLSEPKGGDLRKAKETRQLREMKYI